MDKIHFKHGKSCLSTVPKWNVHVLFALNIFQVIIVLIVFQILIVYKIQPAAIAYQNKKYSAFFIIVIIYLLLLFTYY